MKKILYIIFLVLFVTSCSKGANEDLEFSDHTFEALVGKVRLQSKLIDQGKKNSDTVKVKVPTVIFNPPITIEDVRKHDGSYSKEVNFYANYIKTNINGSKDEILSYWEESKRQSILEVMNDPDMFKKNRDYFGNNPNIQIRSIIKQGDTVSLLVGESWIMAVTLKSIHGKYFLSETSNDLELAIVEASYIIN